MVIIDDKKCESLGISVAVGDQLVTDGLDIGFYLGIVDDIGLLAYLAEKRLAQPALELGRQQGPGGIAHVRQVAGVHDRSGTADQDETAKDEYWQFHC